MPRDGLTYLDQHTHTHTHYFTFSWSEEDWVAAITAEVTAAKDDPSAIATLNSPDCYSNPPLCNIKLYTT